MLFMGKTNRMDEKKVDELVLGDTLSRFFTTRGSHSTFSHRNFSTMKYSVSFFFLNVIKALLKENYIVFIMMNTIHLKK